MKLKKAVLIILLVLLGVEVGYCIYRERMPQISVPETEQTDPVMEVTESTETEQTDPAMEGTESTETEKTEPTAEAAGATETVATDAAKEENQTGAEQTDPVATNPTATESQSDEVPVTIPAGSSYGTMLPDDEL